MVGKPGFWTRSLAGFLALDRSWGVTRVVVGRGWRSRREENNLVLEFYWDEEI